jgi:hypothetical protein
MSYRHIEPIPKQKPWRCEAYRRLVAELPCAHCGRAGPSQVCHGDEGKGMAIKSSDLSCWPGCADGYMRRGCHSMLGSSGIFTRDQRRVLEAGHARKTRATIKSLGLWRADWPEVGDE